MTERRPHWDDALLSTVSDAIGGQVGWDEVYAVIAAVEDWYRHNYKSDTTFIDLTGMLQDQARAKRTEQAEAAIQRVRELHRLHATCPMDDCARRGRCTGCGEPWPCPTIHALDGER